MDRSAAIDDFTVELQSIGSSGVKIEQFSTHGESRPRRPKFRTTSDAP